jgi:signal recognition particle subunit SRP54
MDSSIGKACYDQAKAFQESVKVGSVIITKLDGQAKGGGAISAVAATESPITFIGTGEHFNNFEQFDASSFIKRLLGLGDLGKMVEIVKDVISEEDQKVLLEKMTQGNFTYQDFKTQLSTVLKVGPLGNFMSMIPGLGQQLMNVGGSEEQKIQTVKKQICVLDSMNKKELASSKPLDQARKMRLARGSGVEYVIVHELLENFKRTKKLIDNFSKLNVKPKIILIL